MRLYKTTAKPDELYHYGVKGMKWGVRRYQNYDGTRISGADDQVIKYGHKFERVYTKTNNVKDIDYKKKRLYVSDDAYGYLNDYYVNDPDKIRIQSITAKKKMLIAGERTVNNILQEIGEKPLHQVFDKNGNYNKKINGTERDFLYDNTKVGEKFIKRALEKGYSGVLDPVDYMMGFSPSARILFKYSDIVIDPKEKRYDDMR